jgi:hypothetical protein
MAHKTGPYRMEANAGVNVDVDTGNEGTEIGVTAQGKRNIPSKRCLKEFNSAPTASRRQMES